MKSSRLTNQILPFLIMVSSFGFCMTLVLGFYRVSSAEVFAWRKPLVGSIFALICFLGALGAVYPAKCSGVQLGHGGKTSLSASPSCSVVVKGHHFDCGKFSTHTIRVRGHIFCASCTGLFIGGVGALVGTFLYFFTGWEMAQVGVLGVEVGVAFVIVGFLQLKFSGLARLVVNVLFVMGAFLILVGLDGLRESLFVDLFSILLIVFWIFTRILLSEWDHSRICNECSVACEVRK